MCYAFGDSLVQEANLAIVYIGVDLGGTNIRASLVDCCIKPGKTSVIDSCRQETGHPADPDKILGEIIRMVKHLENRASSGGHKVAGVGVGVPGTVDIDTGRIVFAPNLQWRDVPMADMLGLNLKLPVVVDNDVNMAALGEYAAGAASGSRHCLVMTIGTGIGGAFLIDGRILRGRNNNACEIGHMQLDMNGPACACGRRGCYETLASASALIRMACEAGLDGPEPVRSARQVVDMAKSGNALAVKVFDDYCCFLASGLASLLNIFNPDNAVIGGGVALAGEYLFCRLNRLVKREAMDSAYLDNLVKPAKLGDDSGVIGSAFAAAERVAM